MSKKTFKIITFGCKTNLQESDYIAQELKNIGMLEKDKNEFSDYTIINSCSVTSNTDSEILYIIRKIKKTEANTRIILTGCLAQVDSENLKNNNDIYMILGNSEKLNIAKYILSDESLCAVQNLLIKTTFDEFNLHASKRTRATLKIQDGCNNFCSYCIIPFARGKSRSSKLENIISNIKDYIHHGHKEIVLSAIHLGLWGQDLEPKMKFVDLLQAIEEIPNMPRYRIGSLDPAELDDELLKFLISSKKVCNHFHISLQSATDKTLQNMNRHYSVAETFEKLNFLKNNIPNLNLGADIIVGFPDETEADFDITYNNLEDMPLNYMHIFPYSIRKYTKAADMPNQINENIKKERAKKLKEIAIKKQNDFLNSMLGIPHEILVENNKNNTNLYKGVSSNYLKFLIESEKNISNNIINVIGIKMTDKKIFAKVNN